MQENFFIMNVKEHDDLRIEPREIKESEGFYVYGGG